MKVGPFDLDFEFSFNPFCASGLGILRFGKGGKFLGGFDQSNVLTFAANSATYHVAPAQIQ